MLVVVTDDVVVVVVVVDLNSMCCSNIGFVSMGIAPTLAALVWAVVDDK